MSQPVSMSPDGGQSAGAASIVGGADASGSASGGKSKKSKKTIAGPRRVRLALTRVDPWSVMKASFLLSFAGGIMLIVATAVVWFMLDAMHVFSTIEDLVKTVAGERSNTFSAIVAYLELPRALAVSTIIAVVDMVLVTAQYHRHPCWWDPSHACGRVIGFGLPWPGRLIFSGRKGL